MMIITKAIVISTRNYVDQIFTFLQINKALSQEYQFTEIWKSVHTTPLLYDRFTTELLTKNEKCRIHSLIYYAQPIQELSRKVIITLQKALPIWFIREKSFFTFALFFARSPYRLHLKHGNSLGVYHFKS